LLLQLVKVILSNSGNGIGIGPMHIFCYRNRKYR